MAILNNLTKFTVIEVSLGWKYNFYPGKIKVRDRYWHIWTESSRKKVSQEVIITKERLDLREARRILLNSLTGGKSWQYEKRVPAVEESRADTRYVVLKNTTPEELEAYDQPADKAKIVLCTLGDWVKYGPDVKPAKTMAMPYHVFENQFDNWFVAGRVAQKGLFKKWKFVPDYK